ncbi:MAG: hypothetical protein ACYCVD_03090 [Desulfitobacteriaceae bacterium]
MAKQNRLEFYPQFLSNQDNYFYLQTGPQGCVLYDYDSPTPLYQLQEPLLLAQGVAVNAQTVHLMFLKADGDLCYTLVSRTGTRQTTVLNKLDVRSIKYRRPILLPIGEAVHIFYAYAHQAIPDLWNIEHRFWNGKTWHSVHLGEVVHPRLPLYQVSPDTQGNIHLLSVTFQGRNSLLMHNRFHGAFSIWSSPTQGLSIPREVIDMTSILTPNNLQHFLWVAKTPEGRFEVNWAKRPNAQDLSSTWSQASAPLHTFIGPWHGIGSMEVNGSLWLLVRAEQEHLMLYEGESWRLVTSQSAQHQPMEFSRKTERGYYQTYWLEDSVLKRTPLLAKQLGLNLAQHLPAPGPTVIYPTQSTYQPTTPQTGVPPSPLYQPLPTPATPSPSSQSSVSPDASNIPWPQPIAASVPIQEQSVENVPIIEFQSSRVPNNMGDFQSKIHGEINSNTNVERFKVLGQEQSKAEHGSDISSVRDNLVPLIADALHPLLKTFSTLAEERQHLSTALEAILSNHNQTALALKEIEKQVRELQQNQPIEEEKGFWHKWFK